MADTSLDTSGDRAEELASALARVEERVAVACARAGRPRTSVVLVAVTKTRPASDVRLLAGLGLGEVAENKEQEGGPKRAAMAAAGVQGLTWHFVGQLQRNKAAAVAAWADVVHSVDRERLVPALAAGAVKHGRVLDALVQVDLSAAPAPEQEGGGRGGARPEAVPALCDLVAASDGLRLRGLMAVAPLGLDPAAAFARLAELAVTMRADHPSATWLSAGMSGDLEQAVAAGATHLRIGTALLGNRPPLG